MMVPFGDAIMNLSSIIHSIVNINLPAKIWQLMGMDNYVKRPLDVHISILNYI